MARDYTNFLLLDIGEYSHKDILALFKDKY
jgi:hypothetical protein